MLKYYGGDSSLVHVRELCKVNVTGTSMFEVVTAAKALGFEAYGAKGEYSDLMKERMPCIAHVVLDGGLAHFVVIYKIDKKGVLVGDPGKGLYKLSMEKFIRIWKERAVILLRPSGTLYDYKPPGRVLVTDSANNQDYDISDSDFTIELFSKPPSEPMIPGISKEVTLMVNVEPDAFNQHILSHPFPNPFNPITTIQFTLAEETVVSLVIYDVGGNIIKTYYRDTVLPQGEYIETWNGKSDRGKDVSSGVYFLHLKAGNHSETKRLILLR